jgi:hypothetical protein
MTIKLPAGAHRLEPYVCPLCARSSPNYFDIQHEYCSCCGSTDLPKSCEHRETKI